MGSECAPVEKIQPKGGIYEVSNFNHMNAKVDALTQKIDNFNITPATTIAIVTPKYEIYGVFGHVIANFQLAEPTHDQVNYAQGNPYSNMYNLGWRNHPISPTRIIILNLHLALHQLFHKVSKIIKETTLLALPLRSLSKLELIMENFVLPHTRHNKEFMNQDVHTNELIKQLANKVDVVATHKKILETQIS